MLYSTTGYFFPESPSSLARFATKVLPINAKANLAGNIDYGSPLIYSKVDTLLSRPCERNAVTSVDLDDSARAREERRRASIGHKLEREAKFVERGYVDAELLRTASTMQIPFLRKAKHCGGSFSNTGYPVGANGIIVTTNEASLRRLQDPDNIGRMF